MLWNMDPGLIIYVAEDQVPGIETGAIPIFPYGFIEIERGEGAEKKWIMVAPVDAILAVQEFMRNTVKKKLGGH